MWRATVLAVFYHASAPCRKTQDTTVFHDTLPGAFGPWMAGYKCGSHCPASRGFPMSLQYVRRLISSERQWPTRIAQGRCGCRRPAGWTMERVRALLQCDEGPEGEGWTARAKRSSRSGPSPNRPPAVRAGPCACWPRSWKPVRSWPRPATKPCTAR